MNSNEIKIFLQTAIQLGYLETKEAQELINSHKEIVGMGYSKSILEVALAKQILTQYQIQQVQTSLETQKSKTRSSKPSKSTRIDQMIPGYQILRKLGQGAMGTVYEGIQTSLDRKVAIKLLSPQLTKEKEYIERIGQEAKTLARLNHPNIVAAYDFGTNQGIYYLVMEFVDGRSLDEFLKEGKVFSSDEVIDIMIQTASALQEADQNKLVHRDIKPANIMMNQKGAVKLCDLGLAKEMDLQNQAGLTSASAAVGTPAYMSPEQCRGQKDLDIRSDIYSLGATFFHLATGQKPFDAPGVGGIYAQILAGEVPNPRYANQSLPLPICKLIQRMMAKEREKRPQTPAQLLRELEQLKKSQKARNVTTNRVSTSKITQTGKTTTRFGTTTNLPATPALPLGPSQNPLKMAIIATFVGCLLVGIITIFALNTSTPQKKKVLVLSKGSGTGTSSGSSTGTGTGIGTGKGIKTDTTPTGTGTTTTRPLYTPPNPETKLKGEILDMERDIELEKYRAVLEKIPLLKSAFQGTKVEEKSKSEGTRLEQKILSRLKSKKDRLSQNPEENLEDLKSFCFLVKRLLNLGSHQFQKDLSKVVLPILQTVETLTKKQNAKKSLSQAYEKNRHTVLHFLRVWDFKKAKTALAISLKNPTFKKVHDTNKELDTILENTFQGYQWMCRMARDLASQKKTLLIKTKEKDLWKKILKWIPQGDGFVVEDGNDTQFFHIYLMMPHFRQTVATHFPSRAGEYKKYPFFFLFSGDLKAAKESLPEKYSAFLDREKKEAERFFYVRLGYRSVLYANANLLAPAYSGLKLLKTHFEKTSYFTQYKSRFTKHFQKIAYAYHRSKGLQTMLWADITQRSRGAVKLVFEASNPRSWTDWKLIHRRGESRSEGDVKAGKGLTLRGQVQFPLILKGDLLLEIETAPSPTGLAGLSIYLFEKEKASPIREKVLMGIWFNFRGFTKLPVYSNINESRATKLVSLPASGIVYYKQKASPVPGQIRYSIKPVLMISNKPNLRDSSSHKTLFFWKKGKMGLQVKNTSFHFFIQDPDPTMDKTGRVSILTGNHYITFKKITLTGTLDWDRFKLLLEKIAEDDYQKYAAE